MERARIQFGWGLERRVNGELERWVQQRVQHRGRLCFEYPIDTSYVKEGTYSIVSVYASVF